MVHRKGEHLTNVMKKQAEEMGVKFRLTVVKEVSFVGDVHVVESFCNK